MKKNIIILLAMVLIVLLPYDNSKAKTLYENKYDENDYEETFFITKVYCDGRLISICDFDDVDSIIDMHSKITDGQKDGGVGKNYTIVITDNNYNYVCSYSIYIAYGYSSNNAVISSFTCTKGSVVSGYIVTSSKSTQNGNPAKATLTVNVKNSSGVRLITFVYVFTCKVNGNIDLGYSSY